MADDFGVDERRKFFHRMDEMNQELQNARRLEKVAWAKEKRFKVQFNLISKRLAALEKALCQLPPEYDFLREEYVAELKRDLAELQQSSMGDYGPNTPLSSEGKTPLSRLGSTDLTMPGLSMMMEGSNASPRTILPHDLHNGATLPDVDSVARGLSKAVVLPHPSGHDIPDISENSSFGLALQSTISYKTSSSQTKPGPDSGVALSSDTGAAPDAPVDEVDTAEGEPERVRGKESALASTCGTETIGGNATSEDTGGNSPSIGWQGMDSSRWQDTTNCEVCNVRFLLYRRHHCRKCGLCICSECSPFRLPSDMLTNDAATSDSAAARSVNSPHSPHAYAHRVCRVCV